MNETSRITDAMDSSILNLRIRSAIALVSLVVQNTALVVLLKFTYRPGAPTYASSSVVLTTELVKLVISTSAVARKSCRQVATVSGEIGEQPSLFVPSLLYVIQNNLLFYGAKRLSPLVYIVCTQMKILTTAVISRAILRTELTGMQYVYLLLLTSGVAIVQGQGQAKSKQVSMHNFEQSASGVLAILIACVTSGLAGVLLEKIYKAESVPNPTSTTVNHTVWTRNVQLSLISIPFGLLGMVSQDYVRLVHGTAFVGYDLYVWGVVVLQAIGGLLIAFILKYSNNIIKCLAIAMSICCCAAYSIMIGEQVLSAQLVAGVLLVIFAVGAYSLSTRSPVKGNLHKGSSDIPLIRTQEMPTSAVARNV